MRDVMIAPDIVRLETIRITVLAQPIQNSRCRVAFWTESGCRMRRISATRKSAENSNSSVSSHDHMPSTAAWRCWRTSEK